MTVYFQHVGEKGAARDFPKSLGTSDGGLKRFTFQEIEEFLVDMNISEKSKLKEDVEAYAQDGFQIWGIPSGAKNILRGLRTGDYLLLLESAGFGGSIGYAGRVIARPSLPGFHLSRHLWGEDRFPLIVFLKGNLTSFPWDRFSNEVGYSLNWNPAGQTYRVPTERIMRSTWGDEDLLFAAIAGRRIDLIDDPTFLEVPFQDDAELDFITEEGLRVLREHLAIERSSSLVRRFKAQLAEYKCAVCTFDFERAYGDLGRGFIEAHHVAPLGAAGVRKAQVSDLQPVCSNCHRMLHRKYPVVTIEQLVEIMATELGRRH